MEKNNKIKIESFADAGFNNTSFSFISKTLGYLSYALIAYIFGTQKSTDVFYLSLSFITVCSGLFIIIISSVFSPILIKINKLDSHNEAIMFASSVMTWIIILVGLISICLFFAPISIFSLFSKFPITVLENNIKLLRFFPFILFFMVVLEFMRTFVQSMGQFTVTAIVGALQSIIIIACILTLSGFLEVESLAVGTLLSFLVQFLILFIYSYLKGNKLILTLKLDPHIKELLHVGAPLWIAHLITLASGFYGSYVASGLKTGVLTSVSFAQKIYILPILIIFTPILEIINTKFTVYYHTDISLLKEKYIAITKILFFVLVPFSIYFIFYNNEIVQLLLMRGQFTLKDSIITASCLAIYSISIITTCYLQISSRIMFTMQKTGWTSFWGSIGHLLQIIATYFFVMRYNYIGIPIAIVSVEILFFVPYSFIFMNIYLQAILLKELLFPMVKFVIIALIATVPIRFLISFLADNIFYMEKSITYFLMFKLILSFTFIFAIYFSLSKYLHIQELYVVQLNLKGKMRKILTIH